MNVQLGSMRHMVYTTCYESKSAQYEDTKPFQNTGNVLVRRIHRKILSRRAQTSDTPDLFDTTNDDNDTPYPDLLEGLSRCVEFWHICNQILLLPQ